MFRGTSSQATKRLNELTLDIDNGIMPTRAVPEPEVKPAPVLLGETLDRWLKHKSIGRKARPRTIANYEWLLNSYVKPALGDKPIAEISELDIQELYSRLMKGPKEDESGPKVGAKTIRNLHKVLEPALERAISWKLLTENPCKHVELPVKTPALAPYPHTKTKGQLLR